LDYSTLTENTSKNANYNCASIHVCLVNGRINSLFLSVTLSKYFITRSLELSGIVPI
jgi:hypothetical protein